MSGTASSFCFHQAFREPFAVGPRSFAADYLLFGSAGAFILELDDRQWFLPPQRAALIAAGTPIRVRSTGPATSSSVLFRNGELAAPLKPCAVFAMSDLAHAMVDHASRWGEARDREDRVADTFFLALASVIAPLAEREQDTWLPRPQTPGLGRAAAHALAHLDEDLSVAAMARLAACSERSFVRHFAAEAGMSWSAFLQRARMIRAMELLAGGQDGVTEIGLACGFASTSAFIKAFRRFAGSTPRAYRALALPRRA